MNIKLQYPVFVFTKNDPMVYVFHDEGLFTVTTMEYLKKTNFKKDVFIDSSGMKYFPQSAYVTYIWGFWERIFRRLWRLGAAQLITIDYDYMDAGVPITLNELKTMIVERYPKSGWFHSSWSNVEEFREEINKCDTFEQLAFTLEGQPLPKNKFLRILKGY
jgi:hypothetical protein